MSDMLYRRDQRLCLVGHPLSVARRIPDVLVLGGRPVDAVPGPQGGVGRLVNARRQLKI